jgi:hypothetical protein
MALFIKFVWRVLISTVISIIASMTKRRVLKHIGV